MQYVDLEVVRYAAGMLAAAEEAGNTLVCEAQPCERLIKYLVPDATCPGADGQDVEQRPAIDCREHPEEMLWATSRRISRYEVRLEGPEHVPEAQSMRDAPITDQGAPIRSVAKQKMGLLRTWGARV